MYQLALLVLLEAVSLQTVSVNSTAPCFLNFSAGAQMWDNCGFDEDYLQAALLPWEWITGGYFSMILVAMFAMISYIKYHKAIYSVMIGVLMLPISWAVFPDTFLIWAFIMTGVLIAILLWYVFIKQTKEY